MNINSIIEKTINQYLTENVFNEKQQKTTHEEEGEKQRSKVGHNISASDEEKLRNKINDEDIFNIAALARKIYPDHTPEGAQSQLRKKLNAIKNDNGSEYHLKEKEAAILSKELNKI